MKLDCDPDGLQLAECGESSATVFDRLSPVVFVSLGRRAASDL